MDTDLLQTTEDQDFGTTLILVPRIEAAAARFIDPEVTGYIEVTLESGTTIDVPTWSYLRKSLAAFFQQVANVAGHPKDNSSCIADWYSYHQVETAQLLLEVAKWQTKPVSEWTWPDLLLRVNPAYVRPPPYEGGDEERHIDQELPLKMPAKQIAQSLTDWLGDQWKGRTLPTAERVRVEITRLEKRRKLMMAKWDCVFRYNEAA